MPTKSRGCIHVPPPLPLTHEVYDNIPKKISHWH